MNQTTTIDVGKDLDHGVWGSYSKVVLLLAALAVGVDGLANQVLALAIPALIKIWGINRGDFAPVLALGLVGITVGTAIAGVLGDKFGRRQGLIGSVLLFGVMTAATALVNDLFTLGALRILAGLGLGGAVPNAASLIAEFTPLRRRSRAVTLGMIAMPAGGLVTGLIGAAVLGNGEGWRTLFAICGLIPVAVAVLFFFVLPESPRYLLRQKSQAGLTGTLAKLGFIYDTNATLVDLSEPPPKAPMAALFGPEILMDTIVLWCACFVALLALYTVFSWTPAMLSSMGYELSTAGLALTSIGIGGIFGGFLGTWMIECLGSRTTMLSLCGLAIIGALVLANIPHDVSATTIVLALGIEGIFMSGVQTTLYALGAFVYPAYIRATGLGAALAVGRIGAIVSSFTGAWSLKVGGAYGYFIGIAALMALTFVFLALVRRHTPKSV